MQQTDDINHAYLDNPLNKNISGTHIKSVFDGGVRHKSNYDGDRIKNILTEQNSPTPVMIGNKWSEFAPV